MARARNIKPALFKNEVLGVADPMLTLLFEGLWVLADRAGRLEDRPLRIRAEIFPYRDGVDVSEMLDWLQQAGFVTRYKVAGVAYVQVLNFGKHQKPHTNEPDSVIPEPESVVPSTTKARRTSANGASPSDSVDSARADCLSTDSLNTDPGLRKGVRGTAAPPAPTPAAPAPHPGRSTSSKKDSKSRMVTLKTWLEMHRVAGTKALPPDHAVFAYIDEIGLPEGFLQLQWQAFKARYHGTSKKYIDWGRTFLNATKGNWFRLWRLDGDRYVLTTVGLQAEREHKERLQ